MKFLLWFDLKKMFIKGFETGKYKIVHFFILPEN